MRTSFLTRLFLLIILCFSSFFATAQKEYNNSIIFSNGYRYVPNLFEGRWKFQFFMPFYCLNVGDQFAINYERKVFKNLKIGIGYATWTPILHGAFQGSSGFVEYQPIEKGSICDRLKYKMYDLYILYKFNKFKSHKINIGIGTTYTWGTNDVIDTVYWNPAPPYDGVVYSHYHPADYWGIITKLNYDYLLLHNRVAIGANIDWRKYFGIYSSQIIYGIHTSFNF